MNKDLTITRKITRGLANIAQGLENCLNMVNLNECSARLDHAKDCVRMRCLMLQQDEPIDFVVATRSAV